MSHNDQLPSNSGPRRTMWFNSREISQISVFIIISAINAVNCEPGLRQRPKRALFPEDSATGILVAIAIPLGLLNQEVFMSYNFEANYGMPTEAKDIVSRPLKRLGLVDSEELVGEEGEAGKERSFGGNVTNLVKRAADFPALISRLKFYKFIESKINGLNVNGKQCLLRLICDASQESLFEHNGVMGDLLRIILTPSSGGQEGPKRYLNAELAGRKGDCRSYQQKCSVNLMDYFTSVL